MGELIVLGDAEWENIHWGLKVMTHVVGIGDRDIPHSLDTSDFVAHVGEGSGNEGHPVLNKDGFVSIRVKHVEHDFLWLNGEILIGNFRFFYWQILEFSVQIVNCDFLLQEDHIVIVVHIIVFGLFSP